MNDSLIKSSTHSQLFRSVLAVFLLLGVGSSTTYAQDERDHATLSGSIQADVLVPQEDKTIGAEKYDEWALANTYADLRLQSRYVDAGARIEWNEYPLPGYELDFNGWGLAHFYTKAHWKNGAVTLGDFYEQFGSGFILRTYEERSLGIDNSLRGAHVAWNPFQGVALKVLSGRQRHYWQHNESWVSGADAEFGFDEWIPALSKHGSYLTVGGSYVNKYEEDEDIYADVTHRLNLPTMVHAFDVRARFQSGGWNLLAEFAHKSQDPCFEIGRASCRERV